MTQMMTAEPQDIYYILEKGVKYRSPYGNAHWEEARNIFDEYDGTIKPKKSTNPTDDWAEKWAKAHES